MDEYERRFRIVIRTRCGSAGADRKVEGAVWREHGCSEVQFFVETDGDWIVGFDYVVVAIVVYIEGEDVGTIFVEGLVDCVVSELVAD